MKPRGSSCKQIDYFMSPSTPRSQDGVAAPAQQKGSLGSPGGGHSKQQPSSFYPSNSSRSSMANTPLHSPQKTAQKQSSTHTYAGERRWGDKSQDSTATFFEQIHDFPTTGQPFNDTMMKEMLVSLRGSMHRDLMECVTQMKPDIVEVGSLSTIKKIKWPNLHQPTVNW